MFFSSCGGAEIEYHDIVDRNAGLTHDYFVRYAETKRENITNMLEGITRPMKTHNSIEVLFGVITDAECQIQGGLLCSPREVEVTLLHNGMVCYLSTDVL